jgi:hypothetical protein
MTTTKTNRSLTGALGSMFEMIGTVAQATTQTVESTTNLTDAYNSWSVGFAREARANAHARAELAEAQAKDSTAFYKADMNRRLRDLETSDPEYFRDFISFRSELNSSDWSKPLKL